jgi:hypothetical protein
MEARSRVAAAEYGRRQQFFLCTQKVGGYRIIKICLNRDREEHDQVNSFLTIHFTLIGVFLVEFLSHFSVEKAHKKAKPIRSLFKGDARPVTQGFLLLLLPQKSNR